MNNVMHGMHYRLMWAGFALLLSYFALQDVWRSASVASAFTAAGWALWAAAWFMQPVVPTARLGEMARISNAYAVGPAGLRKVATFGGLACIAIGLVWKFATGA